MNAGQLTRRQKDVLGFMRDFHAQNDQLPPVAVISAHFGWKSENAAHDHIRALARRGELERNAVGKWKFSRRPQAEFNGAQQPALIPLRVIVPRIPSASSHSRICT